ncbi:MAG TPA: hypothetical protein VMG12_45235 [Polyangiaceae bacterium]|nr:hypothetical protein [Polyangiaceae bacterium]
MQTRTSLLTAFGTLSVTLVTLTMFSACMGTSDAPSTDSNEVDVAPAAHTEALTPSADGVSAQARAANTPESPTVRVCRSLLQRGRDCSAVFLPALVAERVRLDIPAGIAAEDRAVGRDALLSQALNEYTDDSTDESIAATCTGLAERLPADRLERLVTTGEACLARDTCEPFVACSVPIMIQP